jgi:branched-chain amino acid transport system ATP-binding protein
MATGLQVEQVTVRFGGLTALSDVSLEAPMGAVLGVIGPNGSGKTTLFNVICGFVRPERGRLVWRGNELRRHRPAQLAGLGIARTLQGLGLFPGLTVLENVMVGAHRHARAGFASALFGLPRSDRDERGLADRALRVLSELEIAGDSGRLPGQLPYGVQKRVVLARALVAEPQLLLLDEPASGLSESEMAELGDLVRSLPDRSQMCVLLVEHHMDLVMSVCNSVVVLDFGRVVASGSPEQVKADPAVTSAYLGEVADDEGGAAIAGG